MEVLPSNGTPSTNGCTAARVAGIWRFSVYRSCFIKAVARVGPLRLMSDHGETKGRHLMAAKRSGIRWMPESFQSSPTPLFDCILFALTNRYSSPKSIRPAVPRGKIDPHPFIFRLKLHRFLPIVIMAPLFKFKPGQHTKGHR